MQEVEGDTSAPGGIRDFRSWPPTRIAECAEGTHPGTDWVRILHRSFRDTLPACPFYHFL